MQKWIKFHRRRHSLERSIDDISRKHSDALMRLDAPTYEDKELLYSEFRAEQQLYEDDLVVLISNYLVSEARRLFIPVPEFKADGGAWEQAQTNGKYHLNAESLSALRSAIRKERKERHEIWLLWSAALTGIIGAITGLAAVLGK